MAFDTSNRDRVGYSTFLLLFTVFLFSLLFYFHFPLIFILAFYIYVRKQVGFYMWVSLFIYVLLFLLFYLFS